MFSVCLLRLLMNQANLEICSFVHFSSRCCWEQTQKAGNAIKMMSVTKWMDWTAHVQREQMKVIPCYKWGSQFSDLIIHAFSDNWDYSVLELSKSDLQNPIWMERCYGNVLKLQPAGPVAQMAIVLLFRHRNVQDKLYQRIWRQFNQELVLHAIGRVWAGKVFLVIVFMLNFMTHTAGWRQSVEQLQQSCL